MQVQVVITLSGSTLQCPTLSLKAESFVFYSLVPRPLTAFQNTFLLTSADVLAGHGCDQMDSELAGR